MNYVARYKRKGFSVLKNARDSNKPFILICALTTIFSIWGTWAIFATSLENHLKLMFSIGVCMVIYLLLDFFLHLFEQFIDNHT
jgi:hypothetical protein